MADVVRFVDGVSTSPAIRLELNDEAPFAVARFTHSPAPLTRTLVSNLMRDGGHSGPSARGLGSLVLDIDLITDDQDTNAEWLQRLARELDRESNWIEYQPQGATYPVFFKTYRAPFATIADVVGAAAFRQISVEIPCDPYALGNLQQLSVGTVNLNPAAGSNGGYFDLTGIKGDAEAPLFLVNLGPESATDTFVVGRRSSGTPTNLPAAFQAETLTLGTDTANPGGGPDGTMSGTGTNNYARTSFATTATMATRVNTTINTDATQDAMGGLFRVYAVVRRSNGTGVINLRVGHGGLPLYNDPVPTQLSTARHVVDLGLVSYAAPLSTAHPFVSFLLEAERVSGTSTLDWDYVVFVPADESLALVQYDTVHAQVSVWDGDLESVYAVSSATTLFTSAEHFDYRASYAGKLPWVRPGVTNRFLVLGWDSATYATAVGTNSASVYAYYYPRYEHVRPLGS